MVSSQRKDIPVVTAYKFKTDTHQHIVYIILYVHYIVKYLMVCMKECYAYPQNPDPNNLRYGKEGEQFSSMKPTVNGLDVW